MQLRFVPPRALCRLVLERAEAVEVAVRREYVLHGRDAECADQLVLEIRIADEEAARLQFRAFDLPADNCAHEVTLFACVAESAHVGVREALQRVANRVRAADRDDFDALARKIASAPRSERLQCNAVAVALDEDDSASVHRDMMAA